jgi:TonB-dependent receptor
MKKGLLLIVLVLITTLTLIAQKGKIDGKITDAKTGNPVSGISIVVKETGKGVATDIEGRFILSAEAGKKYTLQITSTNYQTKEISDVETGTDGIAHIDIALEPKTKTQDEVVVRSSSAKKETVNAVISFQKNTNTVASVISAETIRRSPDKNTGEVLKRTPGASLIDGKFLVIRGLADRYNQAMLNGILLTSTEPDRKSFSFDIIPAPMIDNIIINKAFVPEFPGEWAGGLIQVNTKDIPTKAFLNVQAGSGFNSQTAGHDFYKSNGGKLDWLGIDDGARALPAAYTTKSAFTLATQLERNSIGKAMPNTWAPLLQKAAPNVTFQVNGGFNTKFFGKKVGAIFGINYNKSNRRTEILNQLQSLEGGVFGKQFSYNDNRYTQEIMLGALASFSLHLNTNNKVTAKAIVNVNTNNFVMQRNGLNYNTGDDVIGGELTFRQNTFFTTQLNGEHNILSKFKLKWYGAFNILDGYSPNQRRYQYTRVTGTQDQFLFLVGNSLAQESGSRVFQNLSDYIYTAGGDLSYTYEMFGQKQTVKGGYMLQVKDRLFDAQLFANYLAVDNPSLRMLPIDKIFTLQNFGNGADNSNLFAFNSINNRNFRYLANTILNAGFIQFDNQFVKNLRLVWGVRVEHFDQLLGSVKKWDDRHKHTTQTDFLPGINATLKINSKANIRLSGSQTVIRPEQRELAPLTLYDFELNSAVQGNPNLERTKVTNIDLRYELYPRSGEVFTAGIFYKYFNKPIEQYLQQGGAIFTYLNPEKATAYGAEVEVRKRLDMISGLKNFTIQANAAYIKSNVKDVDRNIDRPLQGQSNYLLNVGLLYDLEKAGLNVTLLWNQIGNRIYLVGESGVTIAGGVPDIWEATRPVFDLQLGKKILNKKAEVRVNVANILNNTQYFYQNGDGNNGLQKNTDPYRFTRKFGCTYSITFNYSF